ncbi:GntR family transcriptional regulator [Streptomyces sp. NPDC059828]|uniref:GntR family transcriptional regulator n=1 Tax=Streptomyces sp. NPDC059828 TaxID=3346965 RepID=UPI00365687D8
MPAHTGRTALYRIRNIEGDLLYIGISERPEYRWFSHRRQHAWWSEAANYSLEWHDDRTSAEVAEAEAIRDERPRHNSTYNYAVPFDRTAWQPVAGGVKYRLLAERIRAEIRSGRWSVGHRIPSFEVLMEAASVSRTVVQTAVGNLRSEGVLDWRPGDGTYVTSIPQ